jgi:hypothetical protein
MLESSMLCRPRSYLDETSQFEPTAILEDSQSTICIAQNAQYQSKTKHIHIKYRYVREKVLDSTVELKYCPTSEMFADILTKGLTYNNFLRFREMSEVKEQSDFE